MHTVRRQFGVCTIFQKKIVRSHWHHMVRQWTFPWFCHVMHYWCGVKCDNEHGNVNICGVVVCHRRRNYVEVTSKRETPGSCHVHSRIHFTFLCYANDVQHEMNTEICIAEMHRALRKREMRSWIGGCFQCGNTLDKNNMIEWLLFKTSFK